MKVDNRLFIEGNYNLKEKLHLDLNHVERKDFHEEFLINDYKDFNNSWKRNVKK